MDAWQRIAKFVRDLSLDRLSTDVVESAKWVLIDTLGAMLAGSKVKPLEGLVEWGSETSEFRTSIAGHQALTSAYNAALINGTAAVSLELDEGNQKAKGHSASHLIPAALAWGEQVGANGKTFLESIICGYEVGTRVGAGANLNAIVHPHGTWGTIGAAVAIAKQRGFTEDEIEQAIRISASFALATSWDTAFKGATVRNLYAGLSNLLGMLTTDFVKAGFDGPTQAVETVYGRIISSGFNEEELVQNLGDVFEITQNYFKIYSCCRYNHAALDALSVLKEQHSFTLDQIELLKVETYNLAATLNNPKPANPFAARFSIPFAIAAYLVTGSADLNAFTEENLTNPKVLEFAQRIVVREDPLLTATIPAKRPARVIIMLRDGRTLSHQVDSSLGGYDNPYSKELLKDKFINLAGSAVGTTAAESIFAICLELDQIKNLKELTSLLRAK